MSALVLALARRSLSGITEANPRAGGFKGWLGNGAFVVDPTSKPDEIHLINVSLSELAAFQVFDVLRFALACLESAAFAKPERGRPRALGWPLIRMYYSGFFGGHAIMRAVGRGIVNVEGALATRLSQIANIYAVSLSVTPGTYEIQVRQIDNLSANIVLRRVTSSAGVHVSFWRHFNNFLTDISTDIANSQDPDWPAVVGRVSEIQRVLTAAGSNAGSWLSQIRNEINYQHEYGVWYPFGASRSDADFVAGSRLDAPNSVRLDRDPLKQTIQSFGSGCLALASLTCDFADQLAVRGPRRGTGFSATWRRLREEVRKVSSDAA
jgi:hypothetical protein